MYFKATKKLIDNEKKKPMLMLPLLAICACSKPKKGSQIYTNGTKEEPAVYDTTYYISGISDISISQIARKNITYNVVHTDGIQRNVSLSISGLPDRIKATPQEAKGYTPFSSNLIFDALFLPAGKYPVKITATPDIGLPKEYTINMIVDSLKDTDCQALLQTRASFSQYEDANGKRIEMSPPVKTVNPDGTIILTKLMLLQKSDVASSYLSSTSSDFAQNVKIYLNCNNGTVSIPQQIVKGYRMNPLDTIDFKISGMGSVDIENKKIEIVYSTDSGAYKLKGTYLFY